jgi:hypothetical protein
MFVMSLAAEVDGPLVRAARLERVQPARDLADLAVKLPPTFKRPAEVVTFESREGRVSATTGMPYWGGDQRANTKRNERREP